MRMYYDLHLHSCLSPCGDQDMTPNNLVHMAMLNGMDMIALTDHNSCLNCRAAVEVGNQAGIVVIPGMELCTSEEAHVVCLFQTVEGAEAFGRYVKEHSPKIPNRPEIFGEQIVRDARDEEIGREDVLLIGAADISVSAVSRLVREFEGVAFPAHIDKDSYSVLNSLGAIPPEADFHTAEITVRGDVPRLLQTNPELAGMLLLQNSDAHYLEQMPPNGPWIDLPQANASCLIKALRGEIPVFWER
ncbi:MAG: PHP domain-containing protein [Clostridiales bacterium]|jgi:PHP family Zn ribbon phosphoesterase|nr:PHP domain-containing protein [Clostridiales bacterium]